MIKKAPTVPALSAAEAANTAKPYVVKLHAQWCAICMVTKGAWSEIEKTYASRVNRCRARPSAKAYSRRRPLCRRIHPARSSSETLPSASATISVTTSASVARRS